MTVTSVTFNAVTNAIDVEYSNGGGVSIPLPAGLISWPGL